MKNRVEAITNACGLIFFGLIFLLINTGYLDGRDVILFVMKFWPTLLVVGGFKIMVGVLDSGKIINLLIDILYYASILYAFFYLGYFNI